MREIKFRAFLRSDQRLPNGITLGYEKYPRGIYEAMDLNFASEIVTLWSEKEQTSFEVSLRKVELLQYTGYKDKNGKEIYDGYIVRFAIPNPTGYENYDGEWVDTTQEEPCGEVVFKGGCYCVKYPNGELLPFNTPTAETCKAPIIELFEVIGNIYENKELLEKER